MHSHRLGVTRYMVPHTAVLCSIVVAGFLTACGQESNTKFTEDALIPVAPRPLERSSLVAAPGSFAQSCGKTNAVATQTFELPQYHSSSSWQKVSDLGAGSYQLQLDSDFDLSGHVLNLASDYEQTKIYSQIDLGNTQQFLLETDSDQTIAFITNPAGSTGITATLYICDVDTDTTPTPTDPVPVNPAPTDPTPTEPAPLDPTPTPVDPTPTTPAPEGPATGLPKRAANGVLVPAQSSGLPLSSVFMTSHTGYWYNHPGVNGTLSDACVRLHDSYWTQGPDGKVYSTWHPAVASTGDEQCYFGHEHGDDPSLSPFYSAADYEQQRQQGLIPIPFGYANAVFASNGGSRHEDHFGHKIFRENFRMAYGNSVSPISVTSTGAVCDALLKLHQGTHSDDGLSNHLHESIAHVRCDALPGFPESRVHVTALVPIGRPGWFSNNCSGGYSVPGQTAGTRGTAENNAPSGNTPNGLLPIVLGGPLEVVDLANASQQDINTRIDGERVIPGAGCINTWQDANSPNINNRRFGQAMNDTWVRPLTITNSQGRDVRFFLKSYYSVFNPSRVFFITDNGNVTTQSSIEACRNPPVGPNLPTQPSDLCKQVLANPSITTYSEASPYNGTIRNLNFKTLDITNHTGTTSMWTDAFGRETSSTDPANAIPQYVSTGYNGASRDNVAGTLATPQSIKVCRPDSGPYPSLPQSDECYWNGNSDLLFAKEWWRDFSSPSLRIHSPN